MTSKNAKTRRKVPRTRAVQETATLTSQGFSASAIAAILGVGRRTVMDYRSAARGMPVEYDTYDAPEPKKWDDLAPDVQMCLEDSPEGFERFFNRFSPHTLAPHSRAVVEGWFERRPGAWPLRSESGGPSNGKPSRSEGNGDTQPGALWEWPWLNGYALEAQSPKEAQSDPDVLGNATDGPPDVRHPVLGRWKDQVITTIPPGFAKSEVTIWFVIWRFILERVKRPLDGLTFDTRIVYISKSNMLASQATEFICSQLEWNRELIDAFGRLKPNEDEGMWRPASGMVDVAGKDPSLKERSLRARGSGEQIQGLRATWIIGDDVVTLANSLTNDQRDKLEYWFITEPHSRLDPIEGHIFLLGTRLNRDDLYGRLEAKTYIDDELDDPEEEKLWDVIRHPALYDPDTGNPSISLEAVSLWPDRFSRKKLMRIRANLVQSEGYSAWEATYQQNPIADEERLVRYEWIYGTGTGLSDEGGCVDRDRGVGEALWARQEVVRVVSMDPTGEGWMSAILADVHHEEDGLFHAAVLDIRRVRRAGLRDMLDTVKIWQEACGPIDRLIFEINAFARWFVKDGEAPVWLRNQGIQVMKHSTARNKADPVLGFRAMATDIYSARVRFPFRSEDTAARMLTKHFADEACNYTNAKDRNDQLMALWFIKNNYQLLRPPPPENEEPQTKWKLPSRLKGTRWAA